MKNPRDSSVKFIRAGWCDTFSSFALLSAFYTCVYAKGFHFSSLTNKLLQPEQI